MIMKEYYKDEFKKLMQEYPEGGIVFTAVDKRNLMVTDGPFGATEVIPYEGEVFDFDWNINEYRDDDWFTVYDNNDVLQMIQTLTKGLKIPLKDEGFTFLS